MGRCKVDSCFTIVLFITGAFFGVLFCYSNFLLVHPWLKHRGNVFFSVRMIEEITL